MNILITLAGKSLRFISEGYKKDKFLLEIGSKKMYTFETGHFVPRNEIIKHSVMWLNDLD